LIWLPLLAAGVLAVYPRLLGLLPRIPPDEYAQAVRAPAWFTVVIGGALTALALSALRAIAPPPGAEFLSGDQVLYGTAGGPLLVADAYTLWGCALLGAVLAVGAWVPAARRSAVLPVAWPFPLVLLLVWLAQLTLLSIRFPLTLLCWLLLLAGLVGLWALLVRPARRWASLELPLVLVFAAILVLCGLVWLQGLGGGATLLEVWSRLSSVSTNFTNGIVLLLALGWLGPALYLPWFLWNRRDEPAMVWLPAVLVVSTVAHLVFVHTLFQVFPEASPALELGAGLDPHFLVQRMMHWMMLWGLVALLAGSIWLAWFRVLRLPFAVSQLRPLPLVAGGLLLIGISVGLQEQQGDNLASLYGLLWLQLGWTGVIAVWLTAGGLLTALTAGETLERTVVQFACWLSLVALAGAPPGPTFRGLAALWQPLAQVDVPRPLILFTLVVTAASLAAALPRWAAQQAAPSPRPGAAWGILAPFLTALLLIILGLLGGALTPLFQLIGLSLLPQTL